ncbi:MAG: N-acetyl sugar amidotransferase [Candidatus Vecturithrix sp.]|nr:N-acetyl sugar amidotransferase [Candidatus Vecturithrix sp.]
MERPYQICTRCIMDTTDPEIEFDENGICNHCKRAMLMLQTEPYCLKGPDKEQALQHLAHRIKIKGVGKKYDCIIGVSGGVDSTYTAYLVKQLGLRPLAVHLDNGWDSELAVKNIENICKNLGIDLYTYVIDWEEFKDLQVAFLKASTPDSEIPTDHAILAILYQKAVQESVQFILSGSNSASESILPRSWSNGQQDWKYIKAIQKQFGTKKFKSFPHYDKYRGFYYKHIRGVHWIKFLDYVEYNRKDAKTIIEQALGWRDYGAKHYESLYTKFFQAYILPTKFGFDKRKAHLSSLICSGQVTREQALTLLQEELYPASRLKEDMDYVVKKFGLSLQEFDTIMAVPPKTYWDYPSYDKSQNIVYYRLLRFLKKLWLRAHPKEFPELFQ